MRILTPHSGKRPSGYSDGIEARGRLIFVAGQIGTTTEGKLAGVDMVTQAEQALHNVVAILAAGNAAPWHVARMTWYVSDMDEYRRSRAAIGAAYRAVMGDHYPAMTLIAVAELVDVGARVEIEVTAVVPDVGA